MWSNCFDQDQRVTATPNATNWTGTHGNPRSPYLLSCPTTLDFSTQSHKTFQDRLLIYVLFCNRRHRNLSIKCTNFWLPCPYCLIARKTFRSAGFSLLEVCALSCTVLVLHQIELLLECVVGIWLRTSCTRLNEAVLTTSSPWNDCK